MNKIEIWNEEDIVRARQRVRDCAVCMKFSLSDRTRIATAVSELARNIIKYAGNGCVEFDGIEDDEGRTGLRLVFTDSGPGIADLGIVMQDGYSTSRGLGLGLPGSKRLMDEFEIESNLGKGTRVEVVKWQVL